MEDTPSTFPRFRFLDKDEFTRLDAQEQFAYLSRAFEVLQERRKASVGAAANDDSNKPGPKGGRAHRY
jgi:hypothetical protein